MEKGAAVRSSGRSVFHRLWYSSTGRASFAVWRATVPGVTARNRQLVSRITILGRWQPRTRLSMESVSGKRWAPVALMYEAMPWLCQSSRGVMAQ